MAVKTCKRCGIPKSAERYYKHKSMKDGLLNICKACTKARIRLERTNNLAKHKDRDAKKWLKKVGRGHLIERYGMSDAEIVEIFNRYSTRKELAIEDESIIRIAERRGIYEEVSKHFTPTDSMDMTAPAILYYFKIDNVYKIGITGSMLEKRYNVYDRSRISEIQIWNFDTRQEALNYEQGIIKLYSKYRYVGTTPFTDGTSTTECFTIDIYSI